MEYVYHESEGGMRFTSAIPSQSMPMRQGGGLGVGVFEAHLHPEMVTRRCPHST